MANRFLSNIRINDAYTLPASDGATGQVITTDGLGYLSFSDVDLSRTQSNFVFYDVKNSSGVTINKGTAVMAAGTNGNSGHILIAPMVADGSVEPKYFLGVLESTLQNGEIGRAIHFGELDEFDTSVYTNGDILWLDPEAPGGYTPTEPLGPSLKIAAAIVINSAVNGKIRVRVQGNASLNDIHDVKLISESDGDLLQWNSFEGVWENKALAASEITSTQISNWDTAYGWGDHSTAGYLTSYTESDTLQSVTDRGATTTNAIVVNGNVQSLSQIRAGGWYNTQTGSEGDFAFEIGISGGDAYALAYNRNTASYGDMNFAAVNFNFEEQGGTTTIQGNEIWHAGNDDVFTLDYVTDNGNITTNAITTGGGTKVTSSADTLTRFYVENTGNATFGSGIFMDVKNAGTTVGSTTMRVDRTGKFQLFNGGATEVLNFQIDENGDASFTNKVSATDLKIESGQGNSIRIGDGFGSGGSATIHNYNADLYLQFNNGQAATNLHIGGGGTQADLRLDTGGGLIKMNRNGKSGDAINIDHVENSNWAFRFQTSSVGNDNASGFWVNTNGTPDMRLRSTDSTVTALIHSNGTSYLNGGNVAIGATSSSSKLTVANGTPTGAIAANSDTVVTIDSSANQYLEFRTTATNTGLMQGILFTDNGQNAFIGYKEFTDGVAGTYGEALHLAVKNFSATDPNNGIYLGTSATPEDGVSDVHMFIKGNGNVGIGTNSPEQKLHVEGTIQLGNAEHLGWAYDNGSYYNYITNNYNSTDGIMYRSGSWTSGSTIICHSFETMISGVWQKRLVIRQDGVIGIGTTLPTNKLDVNGTIRARGGVSTDNSAKEYYWYSENTGNSGIIWRKIGTYNAGGQSSRIMITAVGTGSYSGGQGSGKTTLIAQVNNNNLLEGTFWQEGMSSQQNLFGIVSTSQSNHDIYFRIGPYSEYAFEALISDGTFTTDATTVTPPTFTRTPTREWNVNANLWVASNNYVGIGTPSPTAPLDATGVRIGRDFSLANRATVRLDSASVGSPADILFGHTAAGNESGWNGVYWSLSSRGSSDGNKFHIYRGGGNPTAPSESIIMTIDPNSRVGINRTAPGYALDVDGESRFTTIHANSQTYNNQAFLLPSGGDYNWAYGIYHDSGSQYFMQAQFYGTGDNTRGFRVLDVGTSAGVKFYVTGAGNGYFSGDVVAYSSDARLKDNVRNIDNALEKVMSLNGVTFDWNDTAINSGFIPKQRYNDAGVLAQEVQSVLPQAIDYAPFDREEGKSKSGQDYLTVKYEKLVPLLIEAIKELKQEVNELNDIINKK